MRILARILFGWLSLAMPDQTAIAAQHIDNIGFMKNPPKELREKFPMCDAFLKVKWIDKEKKIGYSRYDFFVDGKKRGRITALVYLGDYMPSLDLDLYNYTKQGTLQKIFSFIKAGKKVGWDYPLRIRLGLRETAFFSAKRQMIFRLLVRLYVFRTQMVSAFGLQKLGT